MGNLIVAECELLTKEIEVQRKEKKKGGKEGLPAAEVWITEATKG